MNQVKMLELIYNLKKVVFPKLKTFFSLLTWQTSLIMLSVGFLMFSGILVVASSNVQEDIRDKVVDITKNSFSEIERVELFGEVEGTDLYVYNLLDENPIAPIDVKLIKEKDLYYFELFPGSYRILGYREDRDSIFETVVIVENVVEKNKSVEISFPENEEEILEDSEDTILEPLSSPMENSVEVSNTRPNIQIIDLFLKGNKSSSSQQTLSAWIFLKDDLKTFSAQWTITMNDHIVLSERKEYILEDPSKRSFFVDYSWVPQTSGTYYVTITVDPDLKTRDNNRSDNTVVLPFEIS